MCVSLYVCIYMYIFVVNNGSCEIFEEKIIYIMIKSFLALYIFFYGHYI